jgi:hypothetical protein
MKSALLPVVLLALPMASAIGAGGTEWGAAVNGVRLGISRGPTEVQPEVRVFVQNVSTERREIFIGTERAQGIAFEFRFVATGPDGKTHEGFELNSYGILGGLLVPSVLRLDAGATQKYRFPLKNIISPESPGDVTFAKLAAQGCSFRVSLETNEQNAKWANLQHGFVGKLTSGESR